MAARRYPADKHLLFISTERHMFCVLSYDAVKGELVTRAMVGRCRLSVSIPALKVPGTKRLKL
jgi:hypothetical protein